MSYIARLTVDTRAAACLGPIDLLSGAGHFLVVLVPQKDADKGHPIPALDWQDREIEGRERIDFHCDSIDDMLKRDISEQEKHPAADRSL